MRRILPLLLCLLPYAAGAQPPAGEIPAELLANSDAVVRLASTEFVYTSPQEAVAKHRTQTTILNRSAAEKGFFVCMVDRTQSLKSFSGTVSDAAGRVIRKLKRSELRYTEYSWSSLADDTGYYMMEIHVPTTPYTVNVEYEIAHKDGILLFAPFMPVTSPATALEKGVYTLSLPQGMPFGYKSSRIGEPEKSTAGGRDIYRWTVEHVPAIPEETAAPPAEQLFPLVFASPYEFRYEGTQGSMRDWASFGAWLSELLRGRDALPDAFRQEIHRLTDTLPTPRGKVRALYELLGRTTRYVSIQLGIGGLQPMPAAEVYRTKFGDCKALTNYLRAMLRECGIASDYTVIHTRRPRMYRDFASANQANHVVLRVPLEADTLWLECTNTDVPFGYIHSGIAGHDALMIADGRGEFVTLPGYADTLNRRIRRVELTLAPDGSATGRITERYEVRRYESVMSFPELERTKQTEYLLEGLKIPLAAVDSIVCTETRGALPRMEIAYGFASPKYVNMTGNRGFAPLFPYRNLKGLRAGERVCDLYLEEGYLDLSIVTIRLPDNMRLETMPRPGSMETSAGEYSLRIVHEGQTLTAEFRTVVRAGTYPRGEEYEAFRKLLNARGRAFNGNIVLKKE